MDWSIGNILWIIIGGAIIGIIARIVLPGRQPIPFWLTILAGIVGMLVGDWLAGLFGVEVTGGIDWIRHALQLLVGHGDVVLGADLGQEQAEADPPLGELAVLLGRLDGVVVVALVVVVLLVPELVGDLAGLHADDRSLRSLLVCEAVTHPDPS